MTAVETAREVVDRTLFTYLIALGYDAVDFDFSALNEMLDDMAEYAPKVAK